MVGQVSEPEYPGSVESQAPSVGGPGRCGMASCPDSQPARTPEPGAMVLRGISIAPPGMPVARGLDLGSVLGPECNPVAVPRPIGRCTCPKARRGLGAPGSIVPGPGLVLVLPGGGWWPETAGGSIS